MTSGNITKKVNCNKIYGKKFHYRDKEIKNSNMKYDVDKNEQRAKEQSTRLAYRYKVKLEAGRVRLAAGVVERLLAIACPV